MNTPNLSNAATAGSGRPASNCSVTHCAAVVMMSPDDPTMILLRQEFVVCADNIESAVEAAKASAMEDNPGWLVQCASALYLSPNAQAQPTPITKTESKQNEH